jgi:hypothetical protein
MHILHNRHEFGLAEETLKLLKPCTKGTKMNCWEALYMNMHYKQGLFIPEQQVTDTNPLFDLAIIPCDLQTTSLNSSSQSDAVHTHTHHRVSPDLFRITHPHLVCTILIMHPLTLPFYYSPEYAAKH